MKDFSVEPRWDVLPPDYGPCTPPPPPPRFTPAISEYEWPGDRTHPVGRPSVLFPYEQPAPPEHTQIQPRCFTCKHFEMCKFKRDYLKTATLIQNDLGDPGIAYELTDHYLTIPKFDGFPLMNEDEYFPKTVIFDNSDHEGKLFAAKFNGINFVNVVYKDTKYFILIQLKYDKESSLYELSSCQEAFYKVPYELNKDSLETIQLNLIEWREKIINARAPVDLYRPRRQDVINTTHFSAALECDLYEWNRNSFEDSINALKRKYPHGIPIDEHGRQLYHIATYHVVDGEVPYSPLYQAEPAPPPPPRYFPPKRECPPPKPPKRRGDM